MSNIAELVQQFEEEAMPDTQDAPTLRSPEIEPAPPTQRSLTQLPKDDPDTMLARKLKSLLRAQNFITGHLQINHDQSSCEFTVLEAASPERWEELADVMLDILGTPVIDRENVLKWHLKNSNAQIYLRYSKTTRTPYVTVDAYEDELQHMAKMFTTTLVK